MTRRKSQCAVLTTAALSLAGQANATWSILIADTKTGEIVLGSATCLTGFDLRENTPVVVAGVGAATAQSFVDNGTRNRSRFLRGILRGDSLDDILQTLSLEDAEHQTRQYGFVTTQGEALTFTGTGAGRWAGGLTGVLPGAGPTGGDLYYAVQGNVLAGEPVVLEAELALIATSGPLSDRLMAAMEAAAEFGGDGRCSCDTSPADSCGSPPEMFEKSADIGYVIVARPGDPDACRPFYPQDVSFTTVAAQPAESGGSARLAGGSPNGQIIRVWDVVQSETGSTSLAVETAVDLPGGANIPFVGFVDLDGDTTQDLVTVVDGEARVALADGSGLIGETFDAVSAFAEVSRAVTGDFDGDGSPDLAGISPDGVWIAWNDAGALSEPVLIPLEGTAADLDRFADSSGDALVVINSDDALISLIEPSLSRELSVSQSFQAEGTPRAITAGRLDDNGPIELVYATTDNQLRFVSTDGSPDRSPITTLPFAYDLRIAPLAGEDDLNEILVISPGSLALASRQADAFVSETLFTGPSTGSTINDLDGDGLLDFAGVTSLNLRSLYLISGTNDGFDARFGCGNGDYYLSLNVANQQRSDPDPVVQLRALYDIERAQLQGVTDAITSSVSLSTRRVSPSGNCESDLVIELSDLDGAPVAELDVSRVRAELLAGPIQLGAVQLIEPGVYRVPVLPTGEVGSARLRVTIDDPGARRPVVLAPEMQFEVRDAADIDADGDLDSNDFDAWLSAFRAGSLIADVDQDGRVNGLDFGAWLGAFNDPCR